MKMHKGIMGMEQLDSDERSIMTHEVEGEDLDIRITASLSNKAHSYKIITPTVNGEMITSIEFQKGPIKEAGPNGITMEALIAICQDRLTFFQSGAWKCEENATALEGLDKAMTALQSRTKDRLARNVEGTLAT